VQRDAVLDREVAIKVLHRSLAGDHGVRGAVPPRGPRPPPASSHPNICERRHDWGAVDGIYYIGDGSNVGRPGADAASLQNAQGQPWRRAADGRRPPAQTLLALEQQRARPGASCTAT
jgi:hypothetical protein